MWDKAGPERILLIGGAVALLWVVMSIVGLWLAGPGGSWLGRLAAIGLPLILITIATFAASASARLKTEARDLRRELDAMRAITGAASERAADDETDPPPKALSAPADRPALPSPQAAAPAPAAVTSPAAPASQPLRASTPPVPAVRDPVPPPRFVSSRGPTATAAAANSQPQLALEPAPVATPPVPMADLARALDFPESAEDTDGFRALRRALRDRRAAQVVQAAQDVLTLLSQDGLYMDDLVPDRARPDLWRRFAKGERGGQMGMVGGIREREALARTAVRMREDPVYRDAAHHFLRRFDHMLADIEPEIEDADLVRLTDSRTARAFMLLGRVAGIFE